MCSPQGCGATYAVTVAFSTYHVSSALNRASITEHGLDWRRMGIAPGIAGSAEPEVQGCFLARGEHDRRHFVAMNNTGGPVDVWRVDHVDASRLRTSKHGYTYYPGTIDPDQLTLVDADIHPERPQPKSSGSAFVTSLVIEYDSDTEESR